jgi:hypothetical protein
MSPDAKLPTMIRVLVSIEDDDFQSKNDKPKSVMRGAPPSSITMFF